MKATFLKSIVLLLRFLAVITFTLNEHKAAHFFRMRCYMKLNVSEDFSIKPAFGEWISRLPTKLTPFFPWPFDKRYLDENWESRVGFFYTLIHDPFYHHNRIIVDEIRPSLKVVSSKNYP